MQQCHPGGRRFISLKMPVCLFTAFFLEAANHSNAEDEQKGKRQTTYSIHKLKLHYKADTYLNKMQRYMNNTYETH